MRTEYPIALTLTLGLLGAMTTSGSGCATARQSKSGSTTHLKDSQSTDTTADKKPQSSFDISYVRGHNLHRLTAEAHVREVVVQSYLDRQLLKAQSTNRERYREVIGKLTDFTRVLAERKPAAEEPQCRSPYTVRVQDEGEELLTAQGCRGESDGLGKIIREAEFLLYFSP